MTTGVRTSSPATTTEAGPRISYHVPLLATDTGFDGDEVASSIADAPRPKSLHDRWGGHENIREPSAAIRLAPTFEHAAGPGQNPHAQGMHGYQCPWRAEVVNGEKRDSDSLFGNSHNGNHLLAHHPPFLGGSFHVLRVRAVAKRLDLFVHLDSQDTRPAGREHVSGLATMTRGRAHCKPFWICVKADCFTSMFAGCYLSDMFGDIMI